MNTVTSRDGTPIAFNRLGEGPALILVDGAFCYRGFGPMGALAPLLAPHYTVFTYDRRGRGESGDTAPYAVEREVDDLAALIEEAGGSAYVYGISSGAALALEAASRLPAIKKLALYEAPFITDDSRPRFPADDKTHLIELVASGRRGDAVEYFMTVGVGMPAEAVAPMRQSPMWQALEAVAPTLVYDTAVMEDSLRGGSLPTELAASITVPALVMGGGASPEWMLHSVQLLADTIPHAQCRILEGQTHEVAAEAIAPALVRFFAS